MVYFSFPSRLSSYWLFVGLLSLCMPSFAQGCFPNGILPSTQGTTGVKSSYNGSVLTPKGHLHLLLIYVEYSDLDIYDAPPVGVFGLASDWGHGATYWNDPNQPLPAEEQGEWVLGQLPSITQNFPSFPAGQNRMFNATLPIDDPTVGQIQNLSQYYYRMSGGQFQVTADIYPIPVPVSYNATNNANFNTRCGNVNKAAIDWIATYDPNFDWSKYDNRTNNPGYESDNSTSPSDGILDYVCFFYRQDGTGNGSTTGFASTLLNNYTIPGTSLTAGSGYTGCTYDTGWATNLDLFEHEFAHSLYASYHHLGANNITGYKFYTTNGWGMMSGTYSQFEVANAWEKWWMGWLTPIDIGVSGTYAVTDLTTQNEALRIAIPNSNGQYLWIENHQMLDTEWDRKLFFDGQNMPGVQSSPGLFMYVVDEYHSDRNDIQESDIAANGIRLYHREGQYDQKRTGVKASVPGMYDNNPVLNVYSQVSRKDNPFSGTSYYQSIPYDINNNGTLYTNFNFNSAPGVETGDAIFTEEAQVGNPSISTYANFGNPTDGFQVGDVVGLSGIMPAVMYPKLNASKTALSPIYLNGIKINVLSLDPITHAYIIHIDLNNYEVNQDKRWCGNLIVPDLSGDKISVASGVNLTIDQSETPNRSTKHPITNDFINPTTFTLANGAELSVEDNATLEVKRNSSLILQSGSTLEVGNGAKVYIRASAHLVMETGCNVVVHDGGEIIIESGGNFLYEQQANLVLEGNSSAFYIKGNWTLGDQAVFTFTGDGFLHLGLPTPTVLFGGNIAVTGTDCGINLIGANSQDEILWIDAGTEFHPNTGLATFSFQDGAAFLGQDAAIILPPMGTGSNCQTSDLILKNASFLPSSTFKFAGIVLYDQLCHDIQHIRVEHSNYGLASIQLLSNNTIPLSVSHASFEDNTAAITTYNRSARLYDVNMQSNEIGWHALATTQTGVVHACQSTWNANKGLLYEGTGVLNLVGSSIDDNYIGVGTEGKVTVHAYCSSISDNISTGFEMKHGANLDLSDLPYHTIAKNVATNNPTTINMAKGGFLRLSNGYNDLIPVTNGWVATGVQTVPCVGGLVTDASHNKWNTTNTSPAWGTDYELSSLISPFCNLYLSDVYLDAKGCSEQNPNDNGGDTHKLYQCNGCERILAEIKQSNGDFDEVELGLNEAVLEGLQWMSAFHTEIYDDAAAVRIFRRILTTSLNYPNAEQQWLLAYSYENLLRSAFDAIANKQLIATFENDSWSYDTETQALLAFFDTQITNESDLQRKLQYKADKATLLAALSNRSEAKQIFEAIVSESAPETHEVAENWICWLQNEEDLKYGTISLTQFLTNASLCSGNTNNAQRLAPSQKYNSTNLSLQLFPNPTNDKLYSTFDLTKETEIKISILDAQGKIVHTYVAPNRYGKGKQALEIDLPRLPKGLYLFKMQYEQTFETAKFFVE